MLGSFAQWKSWRSLALNESIRDAMLWMQKRAAARLKKEPAELSPEERAGALAEPGYQKILELTASAQGYTFPFVRFHFKHGVPFAKLEELFNLLRQESWIASQLSHPISYWASIEDHRGPGNGFEKLEDEIRLIQKIKKAKWIVERLPRRLRNAYRAAGKEDQQRLINAAERLKALGEIITERLFEKIKAMDGWSFGEVLDYIDNYLLGYANASMKAKIDEITALEPEVGVLYLDGRLLAISLRTEKAQKGLCSVANWCINRGRFLSYTRNAVQVNVFDFGESPTAPMFLTGTTISYQGKVTASHDINNKDLLTVGDPAQHFEKLGYPASLVRAVVEDLPRESTVKKLVSDLNLDADSAEKILVSVLKHGYNFKPEQSPESFEVIFDLIKSRLASKIYGVEPDQVISLLKDGSALQVFLNVTQALVADLESRSGRTTLPSQLKDIW